MLILKSLVILVFGAVPMLFLSMTYINDTWTVNEKYVTFTQTWQEFEQILNRTFVVKEKIYDLTVRVKCYA